MSATRYRRRRKGQAKDNPGWFKKGVDPRRSGYKFTRKDRAKGWAETLRRYPHLGLWLFINVKQAAKCRGGAT